MSKSNNWLMGLLGFAWVPAGQVAVVTRGEVFKRIEPGGRSIYLAPGREHILALVDVQPEAHRFTAGNIQSRDGVVFNIALRVEYQFDPLSVSQDKQGGVVMRFRYGDARREIIQDMGQRALQAIISSGADAGDLLTRGTVWSVIEGEVWKEIDVLLKPHGLGLIKDQCAILEVTPPATLAARLENSAQRRMAQESLEDYIWRYNELLRGEVVESLAGKTDVSPRIDLPDIVIPLTTTTPPLAPAQPGLPPTPDAQPNPPAPPAPPTPEAPPVTPTPRIIGQEPPIDKRTMFDTDA